MMGEKMKKCQRCEGFLVRDSIYNLEGQFYHIEVLRCLNCGETVDSTILKAREVKKDGKDIKTYRKNVFFQGKPVEWHIRPGWVSEQGSITIKKNGKESMRFGMNSMTTGKGLPMRLQNFASDSLTNYCVCKRKREHHGDY